MKYIKIHSILTHNILGIAFLILYIDNTVYKLIRNHLVFVVLVLIVEAFLILKSMLILYKKNTIAYSHLFSQLIFIFIMFYGLEFSKVVIVLLIIFTTLLLYFLYNLHDRKLVKTRNKLYYELKIRNNSLITVIYIGYGVFCYVAFILTHDLAILNQIENAMYYVFYPYFIIILLVFRLRFDEKTDLFYTQHKYTKKHLKRIFIRNLLLNILSLIVFLQ